MKEIGAIFVVLISEIRTVQLAAIKRRYSKCLLIHGSFSGNPADPQKARIQSRPTALLKKLNI